MRRNIVAANWKMHFDLESAIETAKRMVELISCKTEIIVCPSFVYLERLGRIFKGTGINLGAQNMFYEKKGAYTGEVSPVMLKSVGCDYVIIGHSERRHIFNENNIEIHKKIVSAIEHDLKPILCVGETIDQRMQGKAKEVVERQLVSALDGVDLGRVVVAYEPVWAIGTGVAADNETVSDMHEFVRSIVEDVPVLYGGSVKDSNACELSAIKDVDGFLVGSASLDPEHFLRIINEFEDTKGVK